MKNLTVVIVTYKTPEKIILDCLKSINTKLKVLIVENSEKLSESGLDQVSEPQDNLYKLDITKKKKD